MRYRLHNRLGSGGFVIEAALTIADIPFDYEPLASDPSTSLGDLIQKQNKWPMCSLRYRIRSGINGSYTISRYFKAPVPDH